MDEFPSNSHIRATSPVVPTNPAVPEQPTLKPVVAGEVVQRKKPLGRRLAATFFNGSPDSVLTYLGRDVLLPALQNLVIDAVTRGIETAVYGQARTPSRFGQGSSSVVGTKISYNRYASPAAPAASSPAGPPERKMSDQPSAFDVHEVVFSDRIDAERVLETLYETLQEYKCVTVANLFELTRRTPSVTDHKFGWVDLRGSTIKAVREGYLLILPEPENLR